MSSDEQLDGNAQLYLIVVGTEGCRPDATSAIPQPAVEVDAGHFLVESEATRSQLYHQVKHELAADTALFVAALAEDPKFKGQNEGVLAWLRDGR